MTQDNKSPLYTLYESLKADNYDVPDTYESFERTLNASGNEGTNNRMTLYNSLKENNYDVPDTYESFANTLFAPERPAAPTTPVDTLATPTPPPATPTSAQYFKLRRGGKDFTVSTDEVNAAGGLAGWAAANPGAPLRVYMQGKKDDGTDFDGHVDLSVAHDRSKQRGYKYTTTSEAIEDKPWQPTEQEKIAISRQLNQVQAQTDAMFAETRERMENVSEYYRGNRGLGFQTVEGKPVLNPETGKMEKTYLTPTGDRTTSKTAADMSTFNFRQAMASADMSVGAQIRRAEAELAELKRKYEDSKGRVHGEWADDYKKNDAPLAAVLAANTYVPHQMSDKENSALRVAIRQREEQLKDLYEERDRQIGKDVGFWRGFGRVVSDSRTWDFGTGDLMDAMTMLNVDKYSAPDATEGEKQAGQEMLKAIHDKQQVEEMYGGNASFWNRAGVMTGYMPSFMLDFALTGGGYEVINVAGKAAARGTAKLIGEAAIKEMTELGVKAYAKKYGVRGIGRMAENWTIKALGTTADDLLIRAPLMTNTVQVGKTTADIIDRKLGDVVVDANGNYDFSNDKTWGSAIWQGEANAIIENYSEMFGAHLDGVVPALAKTFGGKRISGMLARANASSYGQILATTRKQFERLGVSDYFGEVSEEYYGQLWRTMLNLDDAYTNVPVYDKQGNQVLDEQGNPVYERKNLLFTGQFHGDIWGGMALSMGLMGAGKYTLSGIAYGSMKHQVNKADRKAAEIFTPERWETIREIVDSTTNDDMGALAESIINDPNLSDEERTAVLGYMERSLNLRGLNLGAMAQSRGVEDEEGAEMTPSIEMEIDSELSQSYIDGYEASSPQEMNDAQNMFEYQRQRVEGMFDPSVLESLDGSPIATLMDMSQTGLYSQEEIDAARDYINAKTVRDGILQRVNDNIDEQIAQSDAMIDARVNPASSMIQPAIMGLDDRQVYVVGGTLAINPDGTIDREASDESIVVRDAVTGEVEFTDPKSIVSAGEAIDPEMEKAIAVDNIRQQAAQAAADAMNGTLAFNPGDVMEINDGGGLIQVTILGPLVDEESGMPIDGQVMVQFPNGQQTAFAKEQLQSFAYAANLERLNNFEQERAAARTQQQATEAEALRPQFALNDEFTIINESGMPVRGSITGELDEDGTVEIYTEEPINGQRVGRYTPDELEQMFDTYNGQTVTVPKIAENVPNIEETPENAREISENSTETVPNPYEAAPMQPQQTALSNIPLDEQGQPNYIEADADTAWDAIVELSGDEEIAAEVVADYVNEAEADFNAAEKALSKTKEGKPEKRKAGDPAPTMEERIAAKKAAKEALGEAQAIRDRAKYIFDQWKKIAGTKQRREAERRSAEDAEARRRAEERAVEEARLRAEREEADRIEREALNGVPDWSVDTPVDARARGYRRNGPQKVDRPEIIDNHAIGNSVEVKFGDDVMQRGNVVVIDASQLQPSHRDGQRNPAHFLDEAQPKERKDAASRFAASKIAENIRPEEITSSVTAYTGAPSINSRGEVIQGNNRSEALRLMYEGYADSAAKYKQYLIDHAAEFGLTPEAIEAFEQPVLANMLDVSDENAITLGQYVAQDTESGGIERIKPKNAVQKMGDKIRNFANLLLRSADDEATFAQLVDANGINVLKWMNQQGFITNTQYASAFDSKGNLTAEAANDLKGIMYQSIFTGGSTRLEEMFNKMPAKAQRAILATAFRDYDSILADRMISEIQQSIIAFDALMGYEQFRDAANAEASQHAAEAWKLQFAFDDVSGKPYLPSETFSNFALALAAMYKGSTQKHIQSVFNMMYDIVQGTEQDNLFEAADKTPKPLAEAIRRVLNLEYQPITKQTTDNGTNGSAVLDINRKDGQDGRPGSDGNADGAEQHQEETEPADSGAGTASDSGQRDGIKSSLGDRVKEAEAEVNTDPTPAQKEAGNYKKGHVQIGTFDVTIEQPVGSVRRGTDADGKEWETTMQNTYGYIRGTEGVDGDHIDVFLSDNIDGWNGRRVVIVDQYNPDGTFDEHKVMLGFNDKADAINAYLANYEEGWDKDRRLVFSSAIIDDFEKWIESSHRKQKPYHEYKIAEKAEIEESTPENPISTSPVWTADHQFWIDLIRNYINYNNHIDAECLDYEPFLANGGFAKFYSLFGDGYEQILDTLNNESKTAGHSTLAQPAEIGAETQQDANKPVNPSGNKLVTDERYAELRERMRKKLGGQFNMGVDPEILTIGTEMAVYHIEKGARKFKAYASAMIADLGDAIRPYLKSFYNAVRDMPEAEAAGLVADMDSYDDVRHVDIANFDKSSTDAMATAAAVMAEQEAEKQKAEAQAKSINKRNEKNNKAKSATNAPDIHVPEQRPVADLIGDSATYQERETQTVELVEEIGGVIESRVDMLQLAPESVKPLTMTDVKKMASKYPALKDISDTDLQELVELAMTQLTRSEALVNIDGTAEQQRSAYDHIVNLYQIQPSLNARDSERLIKQQYSTPTPFGYVMGQFVRAGGKSVDSMLEPSAGNGALTITVDPSVVHVNDIDEARLANLRKLGFGQVTAQDALLPFSGDMVDVVMTNPPFGTVTEKVYDGVFRISSLEGQMAINALEQMKDDGRAAIVIGGNTSYRTNGSMNPKDAAFFGYLYSHYNVADVINISGKALYSRNGTGYDVRMILIDGRKTGEFKRVFPPVKAKARAEQITTFDELYKRVQDDIQQIQQVGSQSANVQRDPETAADGTASAPVRSGNNRPNTGAGQRPGTTGDAVRDTPRTDSGQPTPGNVGSRPSGVDNADTGNAGSTDNVPQSKPEQPRSIGGGSTQNGAGRSGSDGRGTVASRPDRGAERLEIKPDLNTEKVPYPNQSDNGFTLMSVVPAAQAQVLQKSLGEIGDVDQYLVDGLGYSSKEELYSYLAAEQIDSVALAIHQMNNGNAFIIGDMTGVGKGRQGAALIRYAVKQGKVPIYFTQKPTLYTDNYRDLCDIGSSDLRPFIIASNPKDANIVDADGNIVHKLPSKKEQERVFSYIMEHGTLPDEYDYVLTTYDQIKNGTADYEQNEDGTWNTVARKLPKKSKGYTTADYNGQARRDALAKLAEDNITILDESHTVGGDSGCGRYMQMLTSQAGGVTFLSATFAKRADNMPIYAQRTAIAEAGVKASELIEAIMKGGVTLQEIMSKQLVESGQMIRRERSFEGVTIDWLSVAEETDRRQRQQFNEVADIFNAIRNFQDDYITPIIDAKNEVAAEFGATVGHTQGTKNLGVQNVPFASKMYNLVNQLLFTLKVDAVADRVVENLRNGYKPVISFTNTMEGFLSSAPKGVAMEEVPNFSLTLMRALDGVMRFTEKDADENSEGGSISLNELTTEGQNAYNAIREKIMNLSADLPISPMDAIRMKIEEAGYSVAEITGRTMQLNRTEDGRYIVESRKDRDKKAAMRDFNSGKLDVLMINKSGSTGISLHASSKFEDQRQRVMVFAQFQSDINDEVQMRGRIDRSGQVTRGRYEYIMSTIPAEQRIQMMFKAKLKSLDANTTSSQKSKFNEMEIVDYLNKYGDEVVWEYMKEHPELEERLGDPLDMLQEKKDDDGPRTSEKEDTSKKTGCAGKISRYLAFLSVEEQDEIFREITEAYRVKIQLLDDAGENDLEITTMPLRAETKRKQIWHEGENPGSGNAFADNTYVEEVEVDVLKKPMKRAEIEEATRKLVGDKGLATEYDQQRHGMKEGDMNWRRYAETMQEEITQFFHTKADEAVAKLKEAGDARVAKVREKAVSAATKARSRGENNFSDEEIQSLADTVANEAREKEIYKQRKRREEIMAVKDRIKSLFTNLRAGNIYVVPQDLKQATPEMFSQTFGTFVGFKFNKSYTLGSSTAIFATLDGRRKVELALSDPGLQTIIGATNIAYRFSPKEINAINMENWDSKVPTQTRQKRYIITGNLLQALVDTEKGEKTRGNLISYSTIDGETRQGILMGENFKLTDLRNSASLSSRLAQIREGKAVVSENGDVQIEKVSFGWQHRGDYELRVPKSKQRGGIYTMHPDLLKLVDGHNFITKGNNMIAYVAEADIAKVVDMLSRAPFNLTVVEESKLTDVSADEAEDDVAEQERQRMGDGYGAYTDAEISYFNDPMSKALGKNRFSKKRQAEFAARERQRMVTRIQELVERMHLDNVEIVTDASQLDGKRAKAKGFYNKRTGKITIVIPNNVSTIDAEQTLLHEAVAHYGLRQLFGEHFNTFLDNVYQSADESIRRKIAEMAAKNGWDFRTATEEYLAGLAEDTSFSEAQNYTGWWSKIKRLFLDMLDKIGFEGFRDKVGVVLTDNELRYILWRSYQNLARPDRYRSILGEAADVVKQSELKVGNYAEQSIEAEYAAEGDLYRPGDFSPRDRVFARYAYESMVRSGSYQFKEAVQDSMLGLKALYQAILGKKTRLEDVAGFENAYLFENRMSSMNAGEQHEYFQRYMQPLLKEIGCIAGANERKRRELTDYIMAKHGLERNEYMRNEATANGEDSDRDFAGLIGLTGEADWQSAEDTARQWVDDYESMYDTTSLWEAINKATKATLEKVYLSGIISKETYEKILGMYDYYVPLRGWDETTSDEVYGYLTSKDGPLGGSIMKKAEGRESMADDPIATIGMMADDAIRQGNRNLMKQRFLNFILNHPSDAVSVHDLWLEYNDVTDEWVPVFADIEETDTADVVEQKVKDFEERLEALRTSDPDKYKKGREAQHIPYKVVRGNLREHQILIKRNGRTFVATINGNPRAAQAINGLTNPDVDQNGVVGNMLKAGTWINRQLSAFYTTRNPDFVVGNFFRDMLYSTCMTWVKESPRYARRFHKNFARVNPIVMRRLLGKWENGTLNMGNRLESLFYQFMKNGGETGYTNVRDIEGHKRAVASELKKISRRDIGHKTWFWLGQQLDLLNRSAENCARFAAFVTSRDFGRNIDRAIYDAKEISVNFNKKGSGGKMVNATGQTKLGKTGSYLSGGGRILYVFWNAGVQGMTNFGRQAKLHPAKFSVGATALFTLGYVIPMLAQMLGGGDGDDDDKNAYYNLPEYVRRSNICFYAGDRWITIPLPIEYRAMYGMGELAHGVISGNERYSSSELAHQMASQVSQIMPLDMLEGGGGISPFIPSAAKPFTEAYIMNKGWTGLPVYKDTPFNKNDPEWTKAYASTDTHLVDFAKWLNETSGGDDFKKGSIDINPAKIEYMLNGTFGGLFTFPNKVKKSAETAFGDRDFEWRNMPIANRLIKSGDERTANRKLQNEYFKYLKEYEATGQLMRKYENADADGIMGYAERINFLENSPEYARWEIFDEFKADIDAYREDIAAETNDEERKRIEVEMYAVMRELVDALHDPEAYRKHKQE